jgi:hypothetical protein
MNLMMEVFIKETCIKIKDTVKANIYLMMELFMKDTGKMMCNKIK